MTHAEIRLGPPDLDLRLNTMYLRCEKCGMDWGWCLDKRGLGNYAKLEEMAEQHERDVHGG